MGSGYIPAYPLIEFSWGKNLAPPQLFDQFARCELSNQWEPVTPCDAACGKGHFKVMRKVTSIRGGGILWGVGLGGSTFLLGCKGVMEILKKQLRLIKRRCLTMYQGDPRGVFLNILPEGGICVK